MDLKVVFVIVCLCALAITSTEAGIPRCCVTTKKVIPLRILIKVVRVDVQQGNGACDIPALILHVNGKQRPICAHPNMKKRLLFLQSNRTQNKKRGAHPFYI